MDVLFKIKAPHKTGTTPEKPVSVARVLIGKPQTGTRDYGQDGFRTFIRIWQGGPFNYLGCVSESDRKILSFSSLDANLPQKKCSFKRKEEKKKRTVLLSV